MHDHEVNASRDQPAHSDSEPDRRAQPVDTEQPPRLNFPVVGIGASAGGLEAITDFLSEVPPDSGMAYVFIQHLPPTGDSMLVEILAKRSKIPVLPVDNKMEVQPDHLYVIRPGHTLTIGNGVFHLGERLARPMHNRPVDDFFRSLAEEQRERAIAVIMSGMGSNGSAGAQAIKAVGGLCVAQDPETAEFAAMPRHLIEAGYADYILRPQDIPGVLREYAGHPYAQGEREEKAALAKRDQQHLREILAVLRTRTRQDFNGYKKPTVLRRVQRRMGLNRVTKLGDYAKLLRQSTTEVSALADDLLIHVTGFFRDAEAWEALRERVIVPLISSRETDASIRCWVTACASGEEAYSLAMLLVEEAERVNKPLDIKVFATDMADRTLQNARNGIYPGGIESEIEPHRLERFFQRDDSVYRVRAELRERVVFAPQNLLQDPPFSRLDIITCRNLLIYLEPEMQLRILSLLHFGLREGGALFLGTSETTAGTDRLFEPVDKKTRIFRRVGPTRHGNVDFPLPHAVGGATWNERSNSESRSGGLRPSLSQMSHRALLEHHTPPAVTIDRDRRIVFFHGNTEPFIASPRGEPTRDLMDLVRENVRGAVRTAVHRAASGEGSVTVVNGLVETEPGRRVRIAVTVSPLDSKSAPDYLVVSFHERGEEVVEGKAQPEPRDVDGAEDELRRTREELQSTIEELQTSNEELKASHEEVVSVNEELQSSNEELETSREEMQSLNEELSTVNAQLHSKIEEHQAARDDLSSLLTSTNIAVLFLDTRFRIRRFTPQVRELFEMLESDLGRPLSDLAKKFTDPTLEADAEQVLSTLVPCEREVLAENDRWFLRRLTPYRTADNRIDGVVASFVDVTGRIKSDLALRSSEERFRLLVAGAIDFAMIMVDPNGVITVWNEGAQRLLGYSEAEAIGLDSTVLFTPEDRVSSAPERARAEAGSTGRAENERWYLRKDGTRFWGSGVLTALRQPDGSIRGFVKVLRDETLRMQAEQSLRVSKSAAEEANRMKDEFIAILSHELRTPLSAILLWSKMILNDRVTDPAQIREGLNAIHSSAEAQKELIDDLLDVSRIASGKMHLNMREVDLSQIVRDAEEAIGPSAEAKNLAITSNVARDVGLVRVDPDRIRQVIWNLLSNAVKFTPTGGRIEIMATRDEHQLVIRVSDSGKGIAAQFLPHVFERFRQAEPSHTRAEGGVGLGLAIVKQLVELHGGTIEAQSAGEGKGATFIVRLPVAAKKKDGHQHKPPVASTNALAAKALAGVSVLLVEDDPATRDALAILLRDHGMNVRQAESAETAIHAFEKESPDLILSDIAMPGADGYTLIRSVRAMETSARRDPVPAIALTAFARDIDRRLAVEAGFQMHLGKPIDTEELIAAIQNVMLAN